MRDGSAAEDKLNTHPITVGGEQRIFDQMAANGSPDPLNTTIRLPTWVEAPSLAAQHVAVLMPEARAPQARQ
jgi:hypothetical protein